MATGEGVAQRGKGVEILRYRDEGPQVLSIETLTDIGIALALATERDQVERSVETDLDTKFAGADSGYARDGTTATFSGEALNSPVAPGSLSVEATAGAPGVKDFVRDGNLYLDGAPRKRAASGSFATMASESMVVKLQDGAEQTITFGTEATIALAVATINSQLKGGSAVAQGAEDVDLLSDATGVAIPSREGGGQLASDPVLASVEVVSVDVGITTKLGISAGVSTTFVGTIDYFTGALEMVYPGGYAPSTGDPSGGASILSTNAGPYDLTPGDTLVVDTNGGGDEVATFDAGAAVATGAGGSFAAMSSETMDVQVNGGPVQTVTFGTEATIEMAVQLINEQVAGAFVDAVDANNARITSDGQGTGQVVVLSSVDAAITTKLGLANGTDNGTGDVADINAVTTAEVKALVEADTTGLTVGLVDGKFELRAATSVNVNATSDTETIFGLSTTIATATSGGSSDLQVDYVATQLIGGLTKQILRVPNLSEIDTLVVYAAGSGDACRVAVKSDRLSL